MHWTAFHLVFVLLLTSLNPFALISPPIILNTSSFIFDSHSSGTGPTLYISPLSKVETWAMEEYLTVAIRQGLISKSTFSFGEKKPQTLYWLLGFKCGHCEVFSPISACARCSRATPRCEYFYYARPLECVQSHMYSSSWARRKRQWLSDWNRPLWKSFYSFWGFYQRFICSFNTVAAPLTNLLKGKPEHIEFTPESTKLFNKL